MPTGVLEPPPGAGGRTQGPGQQPGSRGGGVGGVSLGARRTESVYLRVNSSLCVCPPPAYQHRLAWGVGGAQSREESESKRYKKNSACWARNVEAPRKERGGKAGRRRAAGPGPGVCITAAPPRENGLQTAATIMALGPGRASRAHSPSARATGTDPPPASVLQTFPLPRARARARACIPRLPPPSFCVLVFVCVCACVRVTVCGLEKLKIVFFLPSRAGGCKLDWHWLRPLTPARSPLKI